MRDQVVAAFPPAGPDRGAHVAEVERADREVAVQEPPDPGPAEELRRGWLRREEAVQSPVHAGPPGGEPDDLTGNRDRQRERQPGQVGPAGLAQPLALLLGVPVHQFPVLLVHPPGREEARGLPAVLAVLGPVAPQHRRPDLGHQPPRLVDAEAALPRLGAAQQGPRRRETLDVPDAVLVHVHRAARRHRLLALDSAGRSDLGLCRHIEDS